MRLVFGNMLLVGMVWLCIVADAQEKWPSPEVVQMYDHAKENMAAGRVADAIVTLRQAILLAPNQLVLYNSLGEAEYMMRDYDGALKTLTQLAQRDVCDTICYQLTGASHNALHNFKKAAAALQNGLSHFPHSGVLLHELGNIYSGENKQREALKVWLEGIEYDPTYALNYREAANVYLESNKKLWGLLYGEIYINLSIDTAGGGNIKRKLLDGYGALLSSIGQKDVTTFGQEQKTPSPAGFEEEILNRLTLLTPVVSDGVTTENLVMLRTRLIMEWSESISSNYPFSLFAYHDQLIRNGKFDIYNEWLFGAVEDPKEFDIWNSFHDGDISRFLEWRLKNKMQLKKSDFYNSGDLDGLFRKHPEKG